MILFKEYQDYKEVNLEFVKNIPSDWEVKRLKYVLKEINERSVEGLEEHLSMSQKYGLIPSRKLKSKTLQSESYAGGKLCKKGDIVLNRLKAHLAVFSVAPCDGVISPDYAVYRLRDSSYSPRFFENLFKTPAYLEEFNKRVKGIVIGFFRLYSDDFLDIKGIIPNEKDQGAINKYIEKLDDVFGSILTKKYKRIELLEKQLSVRIREAVCKGINTENEMKDSGLSWIGYYPSSWRILKLKYIADYINRGSTPKYIEEGECKVVNQATFSKGVWDESNIRFTALTNNKSSLIQRNDILIASTGGGVLGKAFHVNEVDGQYQADSHVTIIRDSKERYHSKYLYYFFSVNFHLIEKYLAKGATNQTELQRPWLRDLRIPFPNKDEQKYISNYLQDLEKKTKMQIEIERRYIDSLVSLKKVIIAELTMGKIKIEEK